MFSPSSLDLSHMNDTHRSQFPEPDFLSFQFHYIEFAPPIFVPITSPEIMISTRLFD